MTASESPSRMRHFCLSKTQWARNGPHLRTKFDTNVHRAKRYYLGWSSIFSSYTIRILYAYNSRSLRKSRQVVPYVSPSCCERLRIDSPRTSCTLPTTIVSFSSLSARRGLFCRILFSNIECWFAIWVMLLRIVQSVVCFLLLNCDYSCNGI